MLKEIIFTLFITGCVVALPQVPRYNDQLNSSLASNERNGRIVGGSDATILTNPSIVAIFRLGIHICGGTILNANRILTAAHCTGGEAPTGFQIRAGSNRVGTGGQLVGVTRIIVHDSYNSRTLINDISILQLQRNLVLSTSVRQITLPTQGLNVAHGSMAIISGWGGTNTRGDRAPILLQTLTIPVIGNTQCAAIIGGAVRADQLCAGGLVGRDACHGDEGGPLTNSLGTVIIGILSWGFSSQCAVGWPMVYTRVSAYLPFINGNLV